MNDNPFFNMDINQIPSSIPEGGAFTSTDSSAVPSQIPTPTASSDQWGGFTNDFNSTLDTVFNATGLNKLAANIATIGTGATGESAVEGAELANKLGMPKTASALAGFGNSALGITDQIQNKGLPTIGGGTALPTGDAAASQMNADIAGGENPVAAKAKAIGKGAIESGGDALKFASMLTGSPVAFGVMSGLGTVAQDVGQGKGVAPSTIDGLIQGTVGGLTAGLLSKVAFPLMAWMGKSVLSDPMIQSLASPIKDFVSRIFNVAPQLFSSETDGNVADIFGQGSAEYKALNDEFNSIHKTSMGALARAVQTPVEDGVTALKGMQEEQRAFLASKYEELKPQYAALYKKTDNPITSIPNTESAISSAENTLKSLHTQSEIEDEIRNISGMTPETQAQASASKLSPLTDEALENLSAKKAPQLTSYMNTIRGETRNGVNLTLGQLTNLAQSAGVDVSQVGTTQMKDISAALFRDGRSGLAPADLAKWDELTQKWNDVGQNFHTEFADKFTTAATANNFINEIQSGKSPLPMQLENFSEGLNADSQKIFSQMMFNTILDRASTMEPADAAKFVRGIVGDYGSILQGNHVPMLNNFADFADGTIQDSIDGIRGMIGKGNEEEGAIGEQQKNTINQTVPTQGLTVMQKNLANIDQTGVMKAANSGDYKSALTLLAKASTKVTKNPDFIPSLMTLFSDEQKTGIINELKSMKTFPLNVRQLIMGGLAGAYGFLTSMGYHLASGGAQAFVGNVTNKEISSAIAQIAADKTAPEILSADWSKLLVSNLAKNVPSLIAAKKTAQIVEPSLQ